MAQVQKFFSGMLGLVILVAVIGLRFMYRSGKIDDDSLIPIMIAFFVGVILFAGIPSILSSAHSRDSARTRLARDISRENPLPPAGAQKMIVELNALGFHRIGETATDMPGLKNSVTWWLANNKGSVAVEVVEIQNTPMLQFTTVFQDDAVLETIFPNGRNITKKNYYMRKHGHNIPSALQEHIKTAKNLAAKHGLPRTMPTLTDHLNWEPTYRELYINHKLGWSVNKAMVNVGIMTLLVIFFAGLYLLSGQ